MIVREIIVKPVKGIPGQAVCYIYNLQDHPSLFGRLRNMFTQIRHNIEEGKNFNGMCRYMSKKIAPNLPTDVSIRFMGILSENGEWKADFRNCTICSYEGRTQKYWDYSECQTWANSLYNRLLDNKDYGAAKRLIIN